MHSSDEPPAITTAGPEDRERIMATIVLAFATDPITRFATPTATRFLEVIGDFMTAFGGRAFDHGLFGQMEHYHPKEEHWYLPIIGADPQYLGQGLGGALMKHACARIDEDGLPAYLESSNPRNISLYERHGFEVMGEIRSGNAPVMTPMYRSARR